jgi:hypothetical protein
MLFGHAESIASGSVSMAHNTGFTAQRLARVAVAAGFSEVRVLEGEGFEISGVLLTPGAPVDEIAALFAGTALAELFTPDKAAG